MVIGLAGKRRNGFWCPFAVLPESTMGREVVPG
jgi:hypothetical protein